jgi:hypothetical protein
VDPEEHLLRVLQSQCVGSFASTESCDSAKAAIVIRDIVCKPGVRSADVAGSWFSTRADTGIGIVGDGRWAIGFLRIH